MSLMKCSSCGNSVDSNAITCPSCGKFRPGKRHGFIKPALTILSLSLIITYCSLSTYSEQEFELGSAMETESTSQVNLSTIQVSTVENNGASIELDAYFLDDENDRRFCDISIKFTKPKINSKTEITRHKREYALIDGSCTVDGEYFVLSSKHSTVLTAIIENAQGVLKASISGRLVLPDTPAKYLEISTEAPIELAL